MLEMLVALCCRIEDNIMADSDYGDRTGTWFWGMIDNLGLKTMTDPRFDIQQTSKIIDKFIHREYASDGTGGLVHIPNSDRDLRLVEIWSQVMWYLSNNYA